MTAKICFHDGKIVAIKDFVIMSGMICGRNILDVKVYIPLTSIKYFEEHPNE